MDGSAARTCGQPDTVATGEGFAAVGWGEDGNAPDGSACGGLVRLGVRIPVTLEAVRIGRLTDFCAPAPAGTADSRLESCAQSFSEDCPGCSRSLVAEDPVPGQGTGDTAA